MKIAIMQPYFFPYIGYWQLIDYVDEFVILDDVFFRKRSWISRNRIVYNESEHFLIFPVRHMSQNRKINEHFFVNAEDYKSDLYKTIKTAYQNANNYGVAMPLIKRILDNESANVVDFLEFEIRTICEYLNIETKITRASNYREVINEKGQKGIMELCKRIGYRTYINLIGGKTLYDKELFYRNDIGLRFIRPDYTKLREDFINEPFDYSIIDLMMRYKLDNLQSMLKYYIVEE